MSDWPALLSSRSILTAFQERMEESLSRFSELSSFTVVISGSTWWGGQDEPYSLVGLIRQATRILKRVRTSSRPKAVQAQINVRTLTALGCPLSSGARTLEACHALEESLLAFPAFKFQFCWLVPDWRRAGRAEFWSPTIKSAFPKLNQRGLLQLPQSKYNSDPDLAYNELTVSIVTVPPKRALQIPLATRIVCTI